MIENKNLTINESFNLAIKNHQEGKTDIAQEFYNQVLKVDPNHLGALNNLGILFKKLNQIQKAINCYEKVIQIDPDHVDAHNNLGNAFKELGDFHKAKDCYEKVIKIYPDHVESHYNLGVAYSDLDETQKAKDCYEKVIKINPNYAAAHSNLGNSFKILGENEKAIDCYKTAKQIDPNINCDVAFAAAYLKNRNPNNALTLLKTYLKKYPKNPRANAYKTIALRGLERFDEIEELINFSNLVRTINTEILTSEKIVELNKELRKALIEDPRRREEKNTKGWAIRGGTVIRNLFETTNSSILKFEVLLRKAIDYYISNLPDNSEHPFLMGKTKKYAIDTCWANLLSPGDFQSSHIHNNGWMSGVYYLDEPEIEPNKEHAGWIEFNRAGYNLPHFAGEKGIELIKPKAGMFIFFPSYIWHGTIPYTRKYNRISISFDILLN